MSKEPHITKPVYCAIYTRKSTSEGLEKEFTTLDAQRETGESYIKSQKSQGWIALSDQYNDGGFTGADTNRPAIQNLINDIKLGKINCVIVYKVDRLSRSLLDFTRLLEFFDQYKVAFVSVTQHFNTESSMGRLTLNILLSFAQFEREMISERTKDKIGAARKKGKWTGGVPPLGYDVDLNQHKLVINEEGAALVRKIYQIYLELNSIFNTTTAINSLGLKTKKYTSKTGRTFGGTQFKKNTINHLLLNPLYMGKIAYEGKLYDGEHPAILSEKLFEKVQEGIKHNRVTRQLKKNTKCAGILTKLLRCPACDCPMMHTYTAKKTGKKYRYYVCIKAQKLGYATCPTKLVNAEEMEKAVVEHLPRLKITDNPKLEEKYRKIIEQVLPIWETLFPNEKFRTLNLLLTSIDYQAETGSLGMNINAKGIYQLYSELFIKGHK